MRRLRKRVRVDGLKSEVRPRKKGAIGRYVYLGLLVALAFALFDTFAGNLVYLKAEGLVTRQSAMIAPEFAGTVVRLRVREGQNVAAGETVAIMRSKEMIEAIAEQTGRLADVQSRITELLIRQGKVRAILPKARHQASLADSVRHRYERDLDRKGLLTADKKVSLMKDSFDAGEDLVRLEAELEAIDRQLPNLSASLQRAEEALAEMKKLYRAGTLASPAEGTVGVVHVAEGEVVQPGKPLVEVFSGAPYVLAYLPTGRLYGIERGARVALRTGAQVLSGRIDRLLPVASRLPQEFQKSFQTVQRQQLLRVHLDAGQAVPPLFSKVEITSPLAPRVLLAHGLKALPRAARTLVAWVSGEDGGDSTSRKKTAGPAPATGDMQPPPVSAEAVVTPPRQMATASGTGSAAAPAPAREAGSASEPPPASDIARPPQTTVAADHAEPAALIQPPPGKPVSPDRPRRPAMADTPHTPAGSWAAEVRSRNVRIKDTAEGGRRNDTQSASTD